MKLDLPSEGRTMAHQNTSKSTISRRNRMMLYLGQYSIPCGGQSFMGHHIHRHIYWWSYFSGSRDIQQPLHQLKPIIVACLRWNIGRRFSENTSTYLTYPTLVRTCLQEFNPILQKTPVRVDTCCNPLPKYDTLRIFFGRGS